VKIVLQVLNAENPPRDYTNIFFTKRKYWKEEIGQDRTVEHGKMEQGRSREKCSLYRDTYRLAQ